MAWAFPLANGQVIQVTISGAAYDQLIQNRFDVLIQNVSTPANSDTLITSVEAVWAAALTPRVSGIYSHIQTKVQVVTDVIPTTSGYKRVYGEMGRGGPNGALDGAAVGASLPFDITVSIALITQGPPGPYWGRKSLGPITVDDIEADGESMTPAARAAWEAGANTVFAIQHIMSGTTATWDGVVVPAAEIQGLPLPHPALSGLVKDIVACDVGEYVGSQATRRITPNSLRGH